METKKLADIHPDMERYLQEDCYCPNEIYDVTGVFFDLFYPDTECGVVEQTEGISVVVMCGLHTEESPQCVIFWHDDGSGRILDAQRVDATDNNIGILSAIARGEKPEGKLDEYERGRTRRSMKRVLDWCDGMFIS